MLQGLLVQACFPQHLVLVEQQLAVLVIHFVRRRLNKQRGVKEINLLEPLGELRCLCISGNLSCMSRRLVIKDGCIISVAQRQEAVWPYQKGGSQSLQQLVLLGLFSKL